MKTAIIMGAGPAGLTAAHEPLPRTDIRPIVLAVALRLSAWMHSEQTDPPTLTDFHVAFALVSGIAIMAVFDCFGLQRHAGADVSGHGQASGRLHRKESEN